MENQTTNQTKTVSHFFSAPTQPNSTKFSMQSWRFMLKKNSKFFLTQKKYFRPKRITNPNFFWPNKISDPIFFTTQKISTPIFFYPNFFEPKFFWTQKKFRPQKFWPQKFLTPKKFVQKKSDQNFFYQNFFPTPQKNQKISP